MTDHMDHVSTAQTQAAWEPAESADHGMYLDMLIARYVKVAHELRLLERQKDELADLIFAEGGLLPGMRRGGIVVSRHNRFSAAQAKRVLPPEVYASICEPVPSLKLAEKTLAPETFAECKTFGRSFLRLVE